MGNKILLARPHPLIVAEMAPFLKENGFEVEKILSFDEIKTKVLQADGVVISLALSSIIKETAAEVYKEVRRHNKNIPVVFVSLIEFEKALPILNSISNESGEKNVLIQINFKNVNSPFLGQNTTFVYISKNDLKDDNQRSITSRIIFSHFNKVMNANDEIEVIFK